MSLWLLASLVVEAAELQGVVRERGLGDPLSGAVVEAGAVQVLADDQGAFSLELADGVHDLEVWSEGFDPLSLQVEMPEEDLLQVFLVREQGPLEIVVEARRDLPHASWQVLDSERVENTPGTHGDLYRLVQALPGVALTREYAPRAGSISIRGSAPGDSKFFLDGVEIPYLFHFHQYSSVLHTGLLDELAVFPSTFGAEYGDAVGGVVAAQSKPPHWQSLHGGASINLLTGGAWMAAPVGESAGFSGSARRSFADIGGKTTDWYTAWPVFWDYLGRFEGEAGNGAGLAVTLLGAGDRYGRYVSQPDALDPQDRVKNPEFRFERAFHGLAFNLENQVGVLNVHTALAGLVDDWSGSLTGAAQVREERYGWLRQTWLAAPREFLDIAGGFDAKVQSVVRQAAVSAPWIELGAEAPMLARGVAVDEVLKRIKGGAWLEPRLSRGPVRLQTGLRVQGDSLLGMVAVDPRFTARWKVRDDLRFKAALGRYSQSPSLDALSPGSGTPGLGFAGSDQGAVGIEAALAGRWELGAELWGKRLDDVVVEPVDAAPYAADGQAWGVELTSRYRLRERFFSYVSLTAGRSTRDGVPFEFDQPYALNAVFSWHPVPKWKLGFRYRFAAGLPYTPVEDAFYDGNTDSWIPTLGEENSSVLPAYQKLDARIERVVSLRRVDLSAYAEAWWVPAKGNVIYPAWSFDYSQEVGVKGPPFVPLVGMKADF